MRSILYGMRSLIVYNWKTYITSEEGAVALASSLRTHRAGAVVCPSAVHIPAVRDALSDESVYIGAQDISVSADMPETGSQSGEQLRALGVRYVIVGHAETRRNGVTNAAVARKAAHALQSDIVPVICVSEGGDDEERTGDAVVGQMEEIVREIPESSAAVVAYEPTRHIGADRALETETIRAVVTRLREVLAPRTDIPVLYGGAADPSNAEDIVRNGGVDGFLLGRAGVDAQSADAVAAIL